MENELKVGSICELTESASIGFKAGDIVRVEQLESDSCHYVTRLSDNQRAAVMAFKLKVIAGAENPKPGEIKKGEKVIITGSAWCSHSFERGVICTVQEYDSSDGTYHLKRYRGTKTQWVHSNDLKRYVEEAKEPFKSTHYIHNDGSTYTTYESKAKELGAKKWKSGNYFPNGTEVIILNQRGGIVLVTDGNKDVLIDEIGLRTIKPEISFKKGVKDIKVGDKIKIFTRKELDERFELDSEGDWYCEEENIYFTSTMLKMAGKVATVTVADFQRDIRTVEIKEDCGTYNYVGFYHIVDDSPEELKKEIDEHIAKAEEALATVETKFEEIKVNTKVAEEAKPKEKKDMATKQTITERLKGAGQKVAGAQGDMVKTAATLEAARILNNKLVQIAGSKLPFPFKGYANHPAAKAVLANILLFGMETALPDAKDTDVRKQVAEAAVVQAYGEVLKELNIEELINSVFSGKEMKGLLGKIEEE